jgi:hypothetical protein
LHSVCSFDQFRVEAFKGMNEAGPPEDTSDTDLELGEVVSAIFGGAGSMVLHDPIGGGLVLAGGTLMAALAGGVRWRRMRRRVEILEASAREHSGTQYGMVAERIATLERAAALGYLALQSSTTAETDQQAVANGRLLVHGVLDEREAEASFLIRAVARLGETDLRALSLIAEYQPPLRHRAGGPLRAALEAEMTAELVDAVLGGLAGGGFIELGPPQFRDLSLTALGERVAREVAET